MSLQVLRLNRAAVVLVPVLVACFFALCEAQDTGGGSISKYPSAPGQHRGSYNSHRSNEKALKDPGVIIGIIVGGVGVLVVLGVIILLSRLFCCKGTSCCGCCRREEGEHQTLASALSKTPSEKNSPEEKPLSYILQDYRLGSRNSGSRRSGKTKMNPPDYDDLSKYNWDADDYKTNTWDSEKEKDPKGGKHVPPVLGVTSKKRGASDVTSGSAKVPGSNRSRTNKCTEAASDEEESAPSDHVSRTRNFDPVSYQDFEPPRRFGLVREERDEDPETTSLERDHSSVKHDDWISSFNPISFQDNGLAQPSGSGGAKREESPEEECEEEALTALEIAYRTRNFDPSYQDGKARVWDNGRMRIKEPWEAPGLPDRSGKNYSRGGAPRVPYGRENLAFNTDSTETTV